MYTLLLIGCILAVTLCPLLLDAILTWRETHPRRRPFHAAHHPAGLTLVSPRLQ